MTYPRLFLALTFATTLAAQAPRVFFTDLDSGPKTGGENNLGVYVSVYGVNFGSSRGTATVTIGGGTAANYPLWSNSKITFQLGPTASSGDIRVQTSAGSSNGVPFTVRNGNILFVSPTGADTNTGAFASPLRTVQKAVDTMAAGDTAYLMNGLVETRPGSSDGSVTISRNDGAAGAPKALVAYPNAVATIGSVGSGPCTTTACIEGLKTSFASNYWTIAGLRLLGNDYGIVVRGTAWRVIGNELTCPWGNGASACLDGSQTTNAKIWGNNVHDAGFYRGPTDQSSSLYHGIYFSTDSNQLDIGWNQVVNVKGCRGIQIHSSPLDATSGLNQYGIAIHDNVIRNTQCDGIVLATIDPSRGAIAIYNNLIQNAGQGPATLEGSGNFACIYAAGYTNRGPQGAGVVDIYNNTMVNCGGHGPGSNGGVNYARRTTTIDLRLRNNIFYQTNGAPYIVAYDGPAGITGANNLFFGNGPAPSTFGLSGSLNADPRFVNPAGDFHLQGGSPARGSGSDTGLVADIEGALRAVPHDLGAYVGTGAAAPLPVLNPGFSIATSPSSVTLTQGASAITTTVSLSGVNGFSGSASLTCTPAIPGITCFNATAGVGAPVTLTLSFPGLGVGTYVVNILGQSGAIGATTTFTLVIQAPSGGGFGGGGTGGLGGGGTGGGATGGTGTPASAGVRSVTFRNSSSWIRAGYGYLPLTDFRFEARLHGIPQQQNGRGYIFSTDASEVGGLSIRTVGGGARLEVLGLSDDNPNAPACSLELTEQQAADVIVRYQRAGNQVSLRAYDYTGTVELPNSTGNCYARFGPVGGISSLAVGADSFGASRGAFGLAWLRLYGSASAAAPGTIGVFSPILNYEFEDNLLTTPTALASGLTSQTSDQPMFENTPTYGSVATPAGPVTGSFELISTAVTVSTDSRVATSTISLIPRGIDSAAQATVSCANPPFGVTCGTAFPSGQSPATLSLSFSPTVEPGTYNVILVGASGTSRGSGTLSLTIVQGNGGAGSLAGNFGNRSLVISPTDGYAEATFAGAVNVSDFRMEMRLHNLQATEGTLVKTLSYSGDPLGTLRVARDGDLIQIRVTDLPGDFGGAYNCSVQLTTSQAQDFVLRFQRADRIYSLRTWNKTGLLENAAPASAPFCLQAQSTSGQVSGLTVGASSQSGSAAFEIAWLRLYRVSTTAAPGGLPAPSAVFTYEFENSFTSGTGTTALDWVVTGRAPSFVATP